MGQVLFGAWKRTLIGGALVAFAVMLSPAPATAVGPDPGVGLGSVSYSGQPRPFSVSINNNISGSRIVARLTNSPSFGDSALSCSPAGAVNGKGRWRCTASASRRLNPGSITLRVQAVDTTGNPSRSSRLVTRNASVTSSFSVNGGGTVKEGGSLSVTGRFDHVPGVDDYRVTARVTRSGGIVAGQSAVSCRLGGGSFSCPVRTVTGGPARSSYSITVTERSRITGDTRSRSVSATVIGADTPTAPSFSVPSALASDADPLTISGTAGAPGLSVQIAVDSPSFAAITTSCTSSGASGAFVCVLPSKFAEGTHTVYARAVNAQGKISPVTSRSTVVSVDAPTPTPTPTPTLTPTKAPAPAVSPTAAPTPSLTTDPTPDPTEESTEGAAPVSTTIGPDTSPGELGHGQDALVLLLILGLAVVTIGRPGPLSLLRSGMSVSFTDIEAEEEAAAHTEAVGLGDQSGSWSFGGHEVIDEWSHTVPARLAKWSPFLARSTGDGVDLRAMFGALWWLSPLGGLGLGVFAASQAGWTATAPPTGLVIGILLLACFDAFAGLVASVAFGVLVILADLGPSTGHGLLVVLALGTLWSTAPIVANALRPLRRPGSFSGRYLWDRVADTVIVALVVGWLAWAVAASFDVIAGRLTGLPGDATTVGLVAALAIAARVGLAQLATVFWPERLRFTGAHSELPSPSARAVVIGVVLRVSLFAFAGHVLIGGCWQWVVGVLLFALPDVLALIDDVAGWSWSHRVRLPIGVTAILTMVVLGCVLVSIAVSGAGSDTTALRFAFVAASLVPAALGTAQTFDDTTRDPGSTWTWQLAGMAVVAVLAALALQSWDF